jgi:hypothetical protein
VLPQDLGHQLRVLETATDTVGHTQTVSSEGSGIVTSGSVPGIASISPSSGPSTGGTTVTITGAGFNGATKVLFGGVAAQFKVDSVSQITAISPAARAGTRRISVITPTGTSGAVAGDEFTTSPVAPTVATVSPDSGPTSGSSTVTITGNGFNGATKVFFGPDQAQKFVVDSNTEITAVSPPEPAGTVGVRVNTVGGQSGFTSNARFTFRTPAPTVTSVSPASGPSSGQSKVIITGTGFTGVTKVLFGRTPALIFAGNSSTQITAVTPAEPAGTVYIHVITLGGHSAVTGVSYTFDGS